MEKLFSEYRSAREDKDLPESISTTGSDPFRILMAPWYTKYTILTMLEEDREVSLQTADMFIPAIIFNKMFH